MMLTFSLPLGPFFSFILFFLSFFPFRLNSFKSAYLPDFLGDFSIVFLPSSWIACILINDLSRHTSTHPFIMLILSIRLVVFLLGSMIYAVRAAPTGAINMNGKRFALPSGSVCSYQCPTLSSISDAVDGKSSYSPDGITGAPYGTDGTTCTYNYKRTVTATCIYTRSTSALKSCSSTDLACSSTLTSGSCSASATYGGTSVNLISWSASTTYKSCTYPGATDDASGTCTYSNSDGHLITGMSTCPTSLPSYCGAKKRSFVGQETDLMRKIRVRSWSKDKLE